MHVGLTKTINQIAKSKKTLYPFVLWQLTQAADDRGVDGKKFTQASSKLLGTDRRKLFAPLQSPIALLGGFFQGGHLFRYSAVLSLGVIRGLDVDLPKRDDIGAADNADILAPCRGRQPTAQILLSVVIVRVFIKTLYRL